MIEFRCNDLRQQLTFLDVVADINLALGDIAAGTREDVGGCESRGRCRQAYDVDPAAGLDGRHANVRDKIATLFGGGQGLAILRVVTPRPGRQRARSDQSEGYARGPADPPSRTAMPHRR